MYDPRIARFLSVDPLISMPYNSQRYNRYNYVMNNPLKYIDPSGYDALTSKEHDKKWGGNSNNDNDNDSQKEFKEIFQDKYGKGTVTYNNYTSDYNVTYNDFSGHGNSGSTHYTHDSEGQYTTENWKTGEKSAGWNGGNYKQHSNGIETFSDSNINFAYIDISNYKKTPRKALDAGYELGKIYAQKLGVAGAVWGYEQAGLPGALSAGIGLSVIGGSFGALFGVGIESLSGIKEFYETIRSDFNNYTVGDYIKNEHKFYK